MPIDDPIKAHIEIARQAVADGKFWPNRLAKLGLAGAFAQTLATFPLAAQIICGMISNGPKLEERFLLIAEELQKESERIEDKIPNGSYYESDEFQAIIGLILEKLSTMHEEGMLRRFGSALARCGSSDFQDDDRTLFMRILRDLDTLDIQILDDRRLKGWTPHTTDIVYTAEIQTRLFRLAGLGLVTESWRTQPQIPRTGLTEIPPTLKRSYHLSVYGTRFLKFIEISPKNAAGSQP